MPALVTPDLSFAVEEAFGDSQPKSVSVLRKMSETSDELCLKWDGFQENTSKAFINSHKNVDFADVTLACEDGPTQGHSLFFRPLLQKHSWENRSPPPDDLHEECEVFRPGGAARLHLLGRGQG